MNLGEFIQRFIQPNSLIRLIYRTESSGYHVVLDTWDDVSMEWEVLKAKGKYRHYISNNVIGITDILTGGPYSEAINIVIEKLEPQPQIEEILDEDFCNSEGL